MKNLLIIICFFLSGNLFAQLEKKDAFTKGFPQQYIFRGEYQDKTQSYDNWKLPFDNTAGIIKKYVNWDELERVGEVSRQLATQYAMENKNALMLLHWNSREHRNDIAESFKLYYPGHWLTMAGSTLVAPLAKDDQIIYLKNLNKSFTAILADNNNQDKIGEEATGKESAQQLKYPVLLLVELDEKGNKIWDNYEYVLVESNLDIDTKNKTIKIKRGQIFSKSRSFKYGAYVAPMATRLGNKDLFCYNLSSACPKDKNGLTAADVMSNEIVSVVNKKTGLLKVLDGVAFDVMMWEPWEGNGGNADVNNDGAADGGTVNGRNLTREGAYQLIVNLRAKLGENYILTCDGYTKDDQRALGIFNGIESEGLVKHDDAFRGFSKTINVFNYWNNYETSLKKFSYIVPKLKNPNDAKNRENLTRLAIGTATVLEVGIAKEQKDKTSDEILNGTKQMAYWLGKPIHPCIEMQKSSEDRLNGEGVTLSKAFISKWKSSNGEINIGKDNSIIFPRNTNKDAEVNKVNFDNLKAGELGEDLTISFDVESIDSLNYLPNNVPRIVSLTVNGLPVYEKNSKYNDYYNNMWGLFGKDKYTPLSFYYRKASGLPLNLTIQAEGGGSFKIKNFKVYNQPQVLLREFENGIVIVNPSFENYKIDLNHFFPNQKFKKIQGITHPIYNDGSLVENQAIVTPLNALFLVKDK